LILHGLSVKGIPFLMTLSRRLINVLDHPGFRPVLGALVTQYARSKTGLDVELVYDDA
jgi:hypothetical protein